MKTTQQNNTILSIALFFFFAVILGGCVSAKQKMMDEGNKSLSGMELKELFSEKRVANGVNTQKNNTFVVTHMPDGTQSVVGSNGKTYPGTYYIEGDRYCSKMDFRGGAVKCTTWFKVGGKKYKLFNDSGTQTIVLTFE